MKIALQVSLDFSLVFGKPKLEITENAFLRSSKSRSPFKKDKIRPKPHNKLLVGGGTFLSFNVKC